MMEAVLHAVVTILAAVVGVWAVGRIGPMSWRTRPGDIAALVSMAAGSLGLSVLSVLSIMPPFELLVMFFGGLAWWLVGAPVTHSAKYAKPKRAHGHRQKGHG